MPILDRRVQFDVKSRNFKMRDQVRRAGKPLRGYSWRFVQLDQGQEGACVGHAVAMEAAATPKPYFGKLNDDAVSFISAQEAAFNIYHRARVLDGVPDDVWPSGTSLLAGLKAGVEAGYWKGYTWALGPGPELAVQDMLMHVGYRGPVMMASNWYESMSFERTFVGKLPSSAILLRGDVVGGHAYLITRVAYMGNLFGNGRANILNWAAWTPNSWGGAGQGWLIGHDLVRLMAEDGEAAAPFERNLMRKDML